MDQRTALGRAPQDQPVVFCAAGGHHNTPNGRLLVAPPAEPTVAGIVLDEVEDVVDVVVQLLTFQICRERCQPPIGVDAEEK